MSDTPRTDAFCRDTMNSDRATCAGALWSWARTLERELAESRSYAELRAPALKFAGKILDSFADNWGSDFDGCHIQDLLVECGLVDTHDPLTEESIERLTCEGFDLSDFDPGDTFYTYNAHANAAVAFATNPNPSGHDSPEASFRTDEASGPVGLGPDKENQLNSSSVSLPVSAETRPGRSTGKTPADTLAGGDTRDEFPASESDGWERFFHPAEDLRYYCHADGPWWRHKDGHQACGTCYPDPEVAFKKRDENAVNSSEKT